MTEQLVIDAAKVALQDGGAHPYTMEDAKAAIADGSISAYYTIVMATPVYEESTVRVGVWIATNKYRLTTRYVGVSEDAARQMRVKTKDALQFVPLTVTGGLQSTPVMFEAGTDIAEDEGQYSGADDWTLTL